MLILEESYQPNIVPSPPENDKKRTVQVELELVRIYEIDETGTK